MGRKLLLVCFLLLAVHVGYAMPPAQTNTEGEGSIVLRVSTIDQNSPGVSLGLPREIAFADNPRGGVAITLLPDNQVNLYLRFQVCTADMFGRNRFCTRPPDFSIDGSLEVVGEITEDDGRTRTLYEIVIPQGRLRTRLVSVDQVDYYLLVPLGDGRETQYKRVRLFVNTVLE